MPKYAENSVSPPIESAWLGELEVRAMELPDISDVVELEARTFPDPWSADSFLSELERRPEIGYPVVVRDPTDHLVAYAIVWFIVDEAHIGNIAVDPGQQGQGVGTLLLNHILAEASHREMAFATLEVRPSNRAALVLYERLGFRKIAVRKNYYRNDREDALVLALELQDGVEARFG